MTGQLALITGAASGIGRAAAEALAQAGWRLALADRDATVEQVAAQVGGVGTVVDVRDTAAVDAWVNAHPDAVALVNSAGICAGEYLVDSSDCLLYTSDAADE